VAKPPIHTPPLLPKNIALRLADLAGVHPDNRESFCERLSHSLLKLWKRDRRAVSSKPSAALYKAAKAAQTLKGALYSLKRQDREWVDNIMSSQTLFLAGKIHHLESTIVNLAIVFSHAIGRPSSPPPYFPRPLQIKDQMFRELVFDLLSAARAAGGKLPFDKNYQRGALVDALNILRPHLPKGLVPNVLPFSTIQKLKTEFFRTRR
jgi:hypothetical protein